MEIIAELKIHKTNLAILTGQMEKDGLINKAKDVLDKREISYSLTESGRLFLEKRMSQINATYRGTLEDSGEYERAVSAIDEVLHFLSFLSVK